MQIFVVDDGEIEKRLQGLGAIYNAEMNSVPAEDEDEDDDNEDDSAMDEAVCRPAASSRRGGPRGLTELLMVRVRLVVWTTE